MPITQIPFQDPAPPKEPEQMGLYDQQEWESAYRAFDDDARVPHLLIQLQDDLARSRRREAAWISVIAHLILIILVVNVGRLEKRLGLHFAAPRNLPNSNVTFLALPSDAQKVDRKPKTNVLSDKDRIATSRHPELDPKESRRIVSPPPGAPGMGGPRSSQQMPAPSTPDVAQSQPGQPQVARPQVDPNTTARLQLPKPKNDFSKYAGTMSAGSAIEQAARSALAAKQAGTGDGGGGDFGLGTGAHGRQLGQLDILSDTQGVDFGPYLKRILQDVKENWYHLIPESAQMKKGKLAIEFAITKDGKVAGMKLIASSGDVSLDRPAWGSITASDPFPPLPNEFGGEYLALRFRFFYNPDQAELE